MVRCIIHELPWLKRTKFCEKSFIIKKVKDGECEETSRDRTWIKDCQKVLEKVIFCEKYAKTISDQTSICGKN